MGEFLAYSIVSGLLLLAMFLAYKVFLARDNQHSYNRKVILAIYGIAFTAQPVANLLLQYRSPGTEHTMMLQEINLAVKEISNIHHDPVWATVLVWAFITGMAIVAIKTLITWLQLLTIIHRGEKIRANGYTFVLTDNERFAPFSWIHYIVISRSDFIDNSQAIIAHEREHIDLLHWIDLLIAQIVCIINWFNPAAWLMREELMLVHEYQADLAVIDSGHDVRDYQMLLIKKTVGSRFPSLANSLNHSKLKKRITMMHKSKSGAGQKLKALALVPTLALALGVVAMPKVKAAISTISRSTVSISKGSEKLPQNEISAKNFKIKEINNFNNRTTVVVKGENLGDNLTVSDATFTTNGKTYNDIALSCNLAKGSAVLTAEFPTITVFDNTSMTLTINGKKITLDLEGFFNNAQSLNNQPQPRNPEAKAASSQHKSEINPNNTADDSKAKNDTAMEIKDAEIYLDGRKISSAELQEIPTSTIESMSVDKSGETTVIRIISKKAAEDDAEATNNHK